MDPLGKYTLIVPLWSVIQVSRVYYERVVSGVLEGAKVWSSEAGMVFWGLIRLIP